MQGEDGDAQKDGAVDSMATASLLLCGPSVPVVARRVLGQISSFLLFPSHFLFLLLLHFSSLFAFLP